MRATDVPKTRRRWSTSRLIACALGVFSLITLLIGVHQTSRASAHAKSAHVRHAKAANRGGRREHSDHQSSHAAPLHASKGEPPDSVEPPSPASAYVMASFKDGKVMGDGLRLLYSTDGLRWEALPSADKVDRGYGDDIVLAREDIPNARVFRDPSLLWHGGFFHLVFTSELCVYQIPGRWKCHPHDPNVDMSSPRRAPRFGYARSRDLLQWEDVKLVDVPLPDACSLWAPELSLLPTINDEAGDRDHAGPGRGPDHRGGEGIGDVHGADSDDGDEEDDIDGLAADGRGENEEEEGWRSHGATFMISFSATRHVGECPLNMNASKHEPWRLTTTDFVVWTAPERIELPPDDANHSVIDLFPLLVQQRPPSLSAVSDSNTSGLTASVVHASASSTQHTLVYKLEDHNCTSLDYELGSHVREQGCTLVLRQAVAPTPFGPWVDADATGEIFADAISRPCTEGAAILPAPIGGWILLFDQYTDMCILHRSLETDKRVAADHGIAMRAAGESSGCGIVAGRPAAEVGLVEIEERPTRGNAARGPSEASSSIDEGVERCAYRTARKGIGALMSEDLRSWREITGQVSVPAGYKHGTAVKLDQRALRAVCTARWEQGPFAGTAICTPGKLSRVLRGNKESTDGHKSHKSSSGGKGAKGAHGGSKHSSGGSASHKGVKGRKRKP